MCLLNDFTLLFKLLKKKWREDEDDNIHMVILPSESADVVTDDEETEVDENKTDNDLPNDVCATIQLHHRQPSHQLSQKC